MELSLKVLMNRRRLSARASIPRVRRATPDLHCDINMYQNTRCSKRGASVHPSCTKCMHVLVNNECVATCPICSWENLPKFFNRPKGPSPPSRHTDKHTYLLIGVVAGFIPRNRLAKDTAWAATSSAFSARKLEAVISSSLSESPST